MSDEDQTTAASVYDFTKYFPFPGIRDIQSFVLSEIGPAYASGFKYILLEAPTGFGKSPVAVATLGFGI